MSEQSASRDRGEQWQCNHESGDPRSCPTCLKERRAAADVVDQSIRRAVGRPDSGPVAKRASGKKSMDEHPDIKKLREKIMGEENAGIVRGADETALRGFVAILRQERFSVGPTEAFRKALAAAEQEGGSSKTDRDSSPQIKAPEKTDTSALASLTRVLLGRKRPEPEAPRVVASSGDIYDLVERALARMKSQDADAVRAQLGRIKRSSDAERKAS